MKITNWMQAIGHCQQKQSPFVLATVIEHKGSVPRDSGAKMLITSEQTFDTIGGGHLEHLVTRTSREMLLERDTAIRTEEYPLAAKLGQCCGGFAKVLLESYQLNTQNLAIFGAGHVANELVPILQRLPLNLHWIDERGELFPTGLQENVRTITTDCPVSELKALPANTLVLIMTHNHQLDFDLVKCAIVRDDIDFVGVIGSETKAKRFRYKLQQRELSDVQIAKMVSPVGERAVPGKTPIEVAISMAAQITQLLHKQKNELPVNEQVQRTTMNTEPV
ncbi:xanthine dehydrogenase accessory protein XdhC [Planctobacterium marinum]|uniref:Xanthine dehydrogenase accessory protein XdhC n=1 Tax=Planctobacterium marinum TaxID=1631968 RepID=A0AA48HXI8_9ALTE|nr:xanthine dehydrogenase accessory protein XdhC [Planctobacterium marinum]